MDQNTERKETGTARLYDDGSLELIEGTMLNGFSTEPMVIEMDERVMKAAAFLQRNFQAIELRSIAKALALVAPVIWSQYSKEDIEPMGLSDLPIS